MDIQIVSASDRLVQIRVINPGIKQVTVAIGRDSFRLCKDKVIIKDEDDIINFEGVFPPGSYYVIAQSLKVGNREESVIGGFFIESSNVQTS